jgi:hypothetical protein
MQEANLIRSNKPFTLEMYVKFWNYMKQKEIEKQFENLQMKKE